MASPSFLQGVSQRLNTTYCLLLPFTRAKVLQANALLHLSSLVLGFQGHQTTDCDKLLHLSPCTWADV